MANTQSYHVQSGRGSNIQRHPDPWLRLRPHVHKPLSPPPFKQRYAVGVTVCIAGLSRWMGTPERAFILCSDGRLSEGDWGSHDAATKLHSFGYNFLGLMAGTWDTARDLCEEIGNDIMDSPRPTDKAALVSTIERSGKKFCESVLCPKSAECHVLITGFVVGPVMLRVTVKNR